MLVDDKQQASLGVAPVRSDVHALLDSYRILLETAREPGLRRLHFWRVALGTDRFLIEHVRGTLDALNRRLCLRSATDAMDDVTDQEDARRVREFAGSLPPPPSRLQTIWPVVPILIATQLLLGSFIPQAVLSWLDITGRNTERLPAAGDSLEAALQSLASLDVTSLGKVADLLFRSGLVVASLVLVFICVAAYAVLRPLANGLVFARAIRDPSAARRWHVGAARVRQVADQLQINDREHQTFAHLGVDPPGEPRLDLLVRALLPAAMVLVAINALKGYVDGVISVAYSSGNLGERAVTIVQCPSAMLIIAVAVGGLGALRLGWLAYEYRCRRARVGLLIAHAHVPLRTSGSLSRAAAALWAALAVLVLAAVFAGYGAADRKPPSVEVGLAGLTREMTRERHLSVRVLCDEPCELRAASLIDDDGRPARLRYPWLEIDTVSRHPRLADTLTTEERRFHHRYPKTGPAWLALEPGLSLRRLRTLKLSPRQARWLSQRLRPGRGRGAGLEFVVLDRRGNQTRASVVRDLEFD